MALPLPPPPGPGGRVLEAMNALNSYANAMHERKVNQVKAQYAPESTAAEINSKNAYARLVGLQPIGKLLGNEGAFANLNDEQKHVILDRFYKSGTGNSLNQQPDNASFSNWATNQIKNKIENQNPLNNISQGYGSDITGNSEMIPSNIDVEDYVNNNNVNHLKNNQSTSSLTREDYNSLSPETIKDMYNSKNVSPMTKKAMQDYGNNNPKSYAENFGEYKGAVAEGAELGKIRAKDVEALNNIVFNGETNQATLNEVSDILASPTFEKIRNTPLAGHHELAYYAKEGSRDEQRMVGQYYTLTGNLIKDASRDFAGQFRKGEQQLLNGMKPSPSDTVDTAKGKTETLSVLNKMLTERSRLTSKIMSQYHVNKLEASEQADKILDGNKIRTEIHDRLNPKPLEADINFMAQKYNITPDEVKKRLQEKGLL